MHEPPEPIAIEDDDRKSSMSEEKSQSRRHARVTKRMSPSPASSSSTFERPAPTRSVELAFVVLELEKTSCPNFCSFFRKLADSEQPYSWKFAKPFWNLKLSK